MVGPGAVAFWKNLVPHVPAALWPLMFLVELHRPLREAFRAHDSSLREHDRRHMVVLSFIGLIFFFAGAGTRRRSAASQPWRRRSRVHHDHRELRALLQAYIFTQLSILFIGSCIHPSTDPGCSGDSLTFQPHTTTLAPTMILQAFTPEQQAAIDTAAAHFSGIAKMGAGIGAGIVAIGAGIGIAASARQPTRASLVSPRRPATSAVARSSSRALIEGVALFGLVVVHAARAL
jgi:F-type H+-transporting ATPase subunit c